MEINELEKNISNEVKQDVEQKQKDFLGTAVGKAVDFGLDVAISALAPNFIENQVIDIKNNIFEHGLGDGIKKTVEDTVSAGKELMGIVKGGFTDISQMKDIAKSNNLLESVSGLIDFALDKVKPSGNLSQTIISGLKGGKDLIVGNISNNIDETFEKQFDKLNNLNTYVNKWEKSYQEKDFNKMDKEYNKIINEMEDLAPLENIIIKANNIENIHSIIKNNGHDFNLTQNQLELINKL